jgi:hypothetical protein
VWWPNMSAFFIARRAIHVHSLLLEHFPWLVHCQARWSLSQ